MRIITVIFFAFALSGCAQINRALQIAASLNDSALATAEDVQCNRASIRSLRERFNTPEKIKAYNLLCGKILDESR